MFQSNAKLLCSTIQQFVLLSVRHTICLCGLIFYTGLASGLGGHWLLASLVSAEDQLVPSKDLISHNASDEVLFEKQRRLKMAAFRPKIEFGIHWEHNPSGPL